MTGPLPAPRIPGVEQIPDAVHHDDGVGDGDPRPLGGGEEGLGIGLGEGDLVAGDDRHRRRHSQLGEIWGGGRSGAIGGDRPEDTTLREVGERLDGPGQRPHVRCQFTEDASVTRLQRRHQLGGEVGQCLSMTLERAARLSYWKRASLVSMEAGRF